MKSKTSQKQLPLSGKVVQTFEIAGEKVARIYIEPVSIDLLIEFNEEVNLGDVIKLDVSVIDKSIANTINQLPFLFCK